MLGPVGKEEIIRKQNAIPKRHEKEVHILEKPMELLQQAAQNEGEGEFYEYEYNTVVLLDMLFYLQMN